MLCVNWTFQVINGRKQKSILEGMLRNDTVLWKVGILLILVVILTFFILMTILIFIIVMTILVFIILMSILILIILMTLLILPMVPIVAVLLLHLLTQAARSAIHHLLISGMLLEHASKKEFATVFTSSYGSILKVALVVTMNFVNLTVPRHKRL